MANDEKIPTIEDVAAHAGVSTATVSRVLNTPTQVREGTRNKVDAAIDALGYTPNFGGRVLASNRTGTIGAVVPTMDNAIFAEAMQALEESLAESGITLFISSSQYSPERESQKIRALLSRGVDGLVLVGSEARPKIDDLLVKRNIPCVNIWTAKPFEGRVTIGFNNEKMAFNLTQKVCELGHQNIAMISGITEGNGRAQGRVRGFKAALKANNLSLADEQIVETKYSFNNGLQVASAMLAQPDPPTAIVCANDVLAIGAMMAARERGLRVPDDVSITGFDDLEIARVVTPQLTTVRVPHRRMGRAAAESFATWFETQIKPDDIVFEAEVLMRDTLAPPPK